MKRVPSLPTRRLRAPGRRGPRPPHAPQSLRRRVFALVRSESHPPAAAEQARRAAQRRGTLFALATGMSVLALALALHAVLGGPDRRAPAQAGAGGPSWSLRRVGDHGELAVAGMGQPRFGEVYEVWLLRPGRAPAPTDALFTVSSGGSATVDVPGPLTGVRTVMVTPEPLGGSASPTAPAVLSVVLPGARSGG
jgi:hypothetical protein